MNILPKEYKNAINLEHGSIKMQSRVLFVVILLLDLLVSFNPYASSDFSPLMDYLSSGDVDYTGPMAIPVTDANIIYILTVVALEMLCAMIVGIFSGVMARKVDVSKDLTAETGVGKITVRKCIVWILFVLLMTIPFVLSAVYMLIPTLFILPGIVMLPAVYLNGDVNIFKSVGRTVSLLRRNYFKTINVIILIYLTYYVINFICNMVIYQLSSPAAFVISAFIEAWCWTALGRFAAARYGVLRYMKGANPLQTPNVGQ